MVLKLTMEKWENLIVFFCDRKDISDKISSCVLGGTILEVTVTSFFSEKSETRVLQAVLVTHLSENHHWCDFVISLTPSEYAGI